MPLVPIKFPPGMFRPGTVYAAKGRWFTGNLVRWFEGVLQAWGGWEKMERTNAQVSAAISDDGGAFTDETADANDSGTDDVVLSTASRQVNDAFYIGDATLFGEAQITVSTATTDGAVTWEYWDSAAWSALSDVVDATSSFLTAGDGLSVTFTIPSDWVVTTVNSQGPFFYIRARVTTIGTGVAALGTQVWIGPGDAPDSNGRSTLGVDEPIRGMHAWRRNTGSSLLGLGTPTKLYLFGAGALTEITPISFTTGDADASTTSGAFGQGPFGVGPFGVGNPAEDTITEANTWQIDNYGEDLIAFARSDGSIYRYDTSAGGRAVIIANAPTGCEGVFVTAENYLLALGDGSAGPRRIAWPDLDDITNWTASATTTAGDLDIPSDGILQAGRRTTRENLIWTDVDLWTLQYIGGEFIYGRHSVGRCSLISPRAMEVYEDKAIWMGSKSFYGYDGEVASIPSSVSDYVFNDFNRVQASKVHAYTRSDFGEVVWHYPSAASTECDRYVAFNYRKNFFYTGDLNRVAGVDGAVYGYPIAADSNGVVYKHEQEGSTTLDENDTAIVPDIESGPFEIGRGDQLMDIVDMIPDEKTQGDVEVSLFTSLYPNADETENGPFTAANPTSIRETGRQVRIKATEVNKGWRIGTYRLDVQPGDSR